MPESIRSELSSSMSLDSGLMGADSARMRADDAADSAVSVDDLSDEEHEDEEDEDEAEALVRAISLSLAANQAEQKQQEEEEEKEKESKEVEPSQGDAKHKEAKEPEATATAPSSAAEAKVPDAPQVSFDLSTPVRVSLPSPSHPPPAVPSPVLTHITTEAWFDSLCLVSDLLDALFTSSPFLPAYIAEEAVQADEAEVQRLQEEHSTWTSSADAELIVLATLIEEKHNTRLASTDEASRTHQPAELRRLLAASELQSFFHLRSRSLDSLTRRLQLFRMLNVHALVALPLIDLSRSSSSDSSSLAHRVSFCRNTLFSSLKLELIDAILDLTTREKPTSKPRVLIDRQAAAASMQRDGSQSVFMQTYRQLKDTPVVKFLQPLAKGQTYTVIDIKFKGEHVVGEGGPYRQLFNDISRELQAERTPATAGAGATAAPESGGAVGVGGADDGLSKTVLPLFIPSANRQVAVGDNRDKFVPIPSSSSSLHLSLYEFFGKLLGIAIRTGVLMPLDLSSFFFKPLVSQQLTVDDLEGIDSSFVHGVLGQIQQLKEDEEPTFAAHFGDSLSWSTTLSDQSTVDLRPSGSTIPVDFADRRAFAALALQARLNESRAQLKAIHRGLTALIPDPLLSLLTWAELERRVCGTPTIDIELLRRHTEYSGCTAQSAHVQHFWAALSELSQADRRRFVQFCSGSERLPSTDEEFNRGGQKIRLLIKDYTVKGSENIDQRYMRSDTWSAKHPTHTPPHLPLSCRPLLIPLHLSLCVGAVSFFNLELPAYSSLDVMRRMMSAVISMDVGMNADDQIERDQRHGGGHRSDRTSALLAMDRQDRDRAERRQREVEQQLSDGRGGVAGAVGVAVGGDGGVDDMEYDEGDMEDGMMAGEDGEEVREELDEVSEEDDDDEHDSEYSEYNG